MVKNTGGGKHKGSARKVLNASSNNTAVIEDAALEVYAQVTRKLGGGLVEVLTHEGEEARCHIRGKFSGPNKRGNFLDVGSFVKAGKRAYESPPQAGSGKKRSVDLLTVYLPHDVDYLKSLHAFFRRDTSGGGGGGGNSTNLGAREEEVVFSEHASTDCNFPQSARANAGQPPTHGERPGPRLDQDVDFDLI